MEKDIQTKMEERQEVIDGMRSLQAEVGKNAREHGWWDGEERTFGELIALAHSELSEALEEYRAAISRQRPTTESRMEKWRAYRRNLRMW